MRDSRELCDEGYAVLVGTDIVTQIQHWRHGEDQYQTPDVVLTNKIDGYYVARLDKVKAASCGN